MKKWTSFVFIFIILAGIMSFVSFFNPISKTYAAVNNEFVDFTLTGLQGYYPYTYFDAENLNQASYTKKEVFYINQNGEKVNTYRAITDKITTILFTKHSSGKIEVPLSGGMQRLVGTGKYFVYASAGLLAMDSGQKSKITISLTASGKTVHATSNKVHSGGDYSPEWVQTQKIYINNPNEIIKFSFKNGEESSIFNPANFYIFEPRISFGYELEEIYCNLENENVYEGQLIKLNAETNLSRIEQSGELLSYYKNYHKIQWEIIEGQNLAVISGNYLKITGNNGVVKLRARCKASSESDEYIYSHIVKYSISGEGKLLNLTSNFPDGAILSGAGVIPSNEMITKFFVSIKDGYSFSKIVDEEGSILDFTKNADIYVVKVDVDRTRTIKVELIKDIKINEIVIEDKNYDKTDTATIKEIIIDGIEEGHSITFNNNIVAHYSSFLAGNEIPMNLTGSIEMNGEDAYMYNFDNSLPRTYGKILKREVVVEAEFMEKEYGFADEKIKYKITDGLITGESLQGELSRTAGEAVGEYEINVGTLNNPNYSISFASNIFRINKRQITIRQINIENRFYDKSTKVYKEQVQIITNVDLVQGDNTEIVFNGVYESFIGANLLIDFSIKIQGENSEFYSLTVLPDEIRANILPKQIDVFANEKTKIYGENDPELTYFYNEEDLLEGDFFTGEMTRGAGEDVGSYKITIGTLFLENYEINFQSADLTILKKQVLVLAETVSKVYGENDPELTFSIEASNVSFEDIGLILKRELGEDVGEYGILIDSQRNKNYQIEFISNSFLIEKRDLTINIYVAEKDYDGNTRAEVYCNFINLIDGDAITILFEARFDNKNAGYRNISYFFENEKIINWEELFFAEKEISNYNLIFGEIASESRINKKDVVLQVDTNSVLEKQYGDKDPEIKYIAQGVVLGETLIGSLSRNKNEEDSVGTYSINQGSITNEENENYNIIFESNAFFIIKKRNVEVYIENKVINYGDIEPEIIYKLSTETPLMDGINLQDILIGGAVREKGDIAGEYQYFLGSLNISFENRNNFNLIFVGGKLTINKINIEINVLSLEKKYGETDPIFNIEIISGKLINENDISFYREFGENVGVYKIDVDLIESYNVVFTSGFLTINKANIKIKASNIFKTYGENDPELTFSIVEGILMFDDTFSKIFTGKLKREEGENTGIYEIERGSLEINGNYNLVFEKGVFAIHKKEIQVYADEIRMFLDEETLPSLTYTVEGIINGDLLSGELSVENVNGLGKYKISIGSLNSDNYLIQFFSADLTVAKRILNVVIDYVSREYNGFSNVDLTYSLEGDLDLSDLNFPLVLLSKEEGVNVGRYLITASVEESEKYEIKIIHNYFEILPRKIKIMANDINITYGEELPNQSDWTYQTEGEIVGKDLNINLYVKQNYCAGIFEILATITNTNNYDIDFEPGVLTIAKREIVIATELSEYVKTYGNSDPHFAYSIQKGSLYKGDVLQGNITREEGENVGKYALICALFNENYNIIMEDAILIIEKKEVILITSALDKVYDETDIAYLRMPTLSGVINGDDLFFDYIITELARFEKMEIDDDIKVIIYGGQLMGDAAKNYYLTRPTNLKANITKAVVENDLGNIFIYATENNTKLKKGTEVSALEKEIEEKHFGISKSVVVGYDVSLQYNEEELNSYGSLKVSIDLGEKEYFNVQLYKLKQDGSMEILKSEYRDGKVYFDTEDLGTYIVVADNDKWIDYTLIALTSSILVLLGWIAFVKENKKHKKRLKENSKN